MNVLYWAEQKGRPLGSQALNWNTRGPIKKKSPLAALTVASLCPVLLVWRHTRWSIQERSLPALSVTSISPDLKLWRDIQVSTQEKKKPQERNLPAPGVTSISPALITWRNTRILIQEINPFPALNVASLSLTLDASRDTQWCTQAIGPLAVQTVTNLTTIMVAWRLTKGTILTTNLPAFSVISLTPSLTTWHNTRGNIQKTRQGRSQRRIQKIFLKQKTLQMLQAMKTRSQRYQLHRFFLNERIYWTINLSSVIEIIKYLTTTKF